VKGSVTGGTGVNAPLGPAIWVIVNSPVIDPSGTPKSTARERSFVPANVPLMTGRSGTWMEYCQVH
jgi:hypothetical protein